MNRKGALAVSVGIVAVITMLIGVYLADELTSPICNCIPGEDIDKTLLYEVWNNDTCDGAKCETDYSVTCNSTELEVGTEYSIDDCNIMLENLTWNNTVCTLAYTYEGDNYHGDDIFATVMCNIPVIALTAGLVLAGAWLFMQR